MTAHEREPLIWIAFPATCGSVGANYRAACRGRSNAEKQARLGVAMEESDDSLYWLELLDDVPLGDAARRGQLLQEAKELTAIFTACFYNMP